MDEYTMEGLTGMVEKYFETIYDLKIGHAALQRVIDNIKETIAPRPEQIVIIHGQIKKFLDSIIGYYISQSIPDLIEMSQNIIDEYNKTMIKLTQSARNGALKSK